MIAASVPIEKFEPENWKESSGGKAARGDHAPKIAIAVVRKRASPYLPYPVNWLWPTGSGLTHYKTE
jgi:hypothetical protein